MPDLFARVREWLGVPHTPDAEKELMERTLREQRRRIERIDAGLPVDRRHVLTPHRRERRH